MTLRERIADWISGGMFENERTAARILCLSLGDARAEAANIAAQRDEAIARAEVAEEKLAKMQRSRDRYREAWESEKRRFSEASANWHGENAILTARNITEARKIAKQALGEE
jgi:hypothetical protein